MKPIDWTLIAIASARNQPLQPVQLQKSLFLLDRNLTHKQRQTRNFYKFDPYDYGPFCNSIYSDTEVLEANGLIVIQRPPEARYKLYSATEAGAEEAVKLQNGLDKDVVDYLQAVVGFTQSVSFNQLVSTIYEAYPEMKANSVFQG